MTNEKNKYTILTKKEEKFLEETKKAIAASGARIMMLNIEVEQLKKEMEETDKELRAFL